MRVSVAMIDALAGAAGAVLRFDRPADHVLSAHFRSHPELGQRDRGFIAETIYALLRRKRLVETAAAETGVPNPSPRHLALAAAVRVRGVNVRELAGALRADEPVWLDHVKGAARGPLAFAVECDLPD